MLAWLQIREVGLTITLQVQVLLGQTLLQLLGERGMARLLAMRLT